MSSEEWVFAGIGCLFGVAALLTDRIAEGAAILLITGVFVWAIHPRVGE